MNKSSLIMIDYSNTTQLQVLVFCFAFVFTVISESRNDLTSNFTHYSCKEPYCFPVGVIKWL